MIGGKDFTGRGSNMWKILRIEKNKELLSGLKFG